MTKTWKTPKANDPEKRGNFDPSDPRTGIAGQSAMWASPNSHDGGRSSNTTNQRPDGSKRQVDLGAISKAWQTPASDSFRSCGGDRKDEMGLDQQSRSFAPGPPTSELGPDSSNSAQTSPRQLNPKFCSMLMGFPPEWMLCGSPATPSFQSWLRQHSAYLRAVLWSKP